MAGRSTSEPAAPPALILKRILVPVDFSNHTRPLVDKALSLARVHNAELYFLYVNPVGSSEAMSNQAQKTNNELAENRLADLQDNLEYPEEKIFLMIETGPIAQHILACAKHMDADLLVMGSHGHGAAYTLLVGSNTEGVLRKSDVPILVIPLKE